MILLGNSLLGLLDLDQRLWIVLTSRVLLSLLGLYRTPATSALVNMQRWVLIARTCFVAVCLGVVYSVLVLTATRSAYTEFNDAVSR